MAKESGRSFSIGRMPDANFPLQMLLSQASRPALMVTDVIARPSASTRRLPTRPFTVHTASWIRTLSGISSPLRKWNDEMPAAASTLVASVTASRRGFAVGAARAGGGDGPAVPPVLVREIFA